MFDRFVLAVFLMDYHTGQWSRGYRILCRLTRINFNISAAYAQECRDHPCYAHLVANYADKV